MKWLKVTIANDCNSMNRIKFTVLAHLLYVVLSTSAGCVGKHGILNVDQHANIPKGAIPEPAGRKSQAIFEGQILSAEQDRYFLYQADFIGKTKDLSDSARHRLASMLASGELSGQQLYVEPSENADLDQNRIAETNAVLEELGITSTVVHLAHPPAISLTGVVQGLGGGGGSGTNLGGRASSQLPRNAPFGSWVQPR